MKIMIETGSHIAALLLRMFIMYFPFMIEAGMVYKAIPPLYSIKEGKKSRYFTEQIDIVKFVQKKFLEKNTLTTLKKEQITSKDITIFFLRNADYIYHLEKIADTYAVNPYLLEMVLIHYVINKDSIDVKKLRKEVTSAYRFMKVELEGSTIVIRGSIESSNLIIISDKFLHDCTNILNLIKENDNLYYLLNSNRASIYTIMKAYKAAEPPNVQRYKGLGEMDKEELAESALHPAMDRTLIRYTMDDAKEAVNIIREYESNTKKILDLVGVVTRDDLLD